MGFVEAMLAFLSLAKGHVTDLVLLIVFFFFWRSQKQIKESSKKSEEAFDRIEKTQSSYIPSISKRMTEIIKSSATINRQLDVLLEKLGADRGWVYIFHNSGCDFLGQPFAKITNTNESLKPGVKSVINKMKDIPVGVMACYIESLLNNKQIKCPDIEQYKGHDKTAYTYLKESGIKSTYTIALFIPRDDIHMTEDGRNAIGEVPLGFVGIDFTRQKKELTEEEFKEFHAAAMIIKGLLIERRNEEINGTNY